MSVLREIVEVRQEPEVVFDAVADFSSSAQWDPGVVAAERVSDGATAPTDVGAIYRLTVTFRGRSSEMTYRTTQYRRPDRVVFEGAGPRIAATDTIEFARIDGGGTRITYVADLRLTGLAKVAEPFLGRSFEEMGARALAGMKAWFAERPAHPG
ncbi:MAG: SRPBCC family protein [Actinomycetota bacterium]